MSNSVTAAGLRRESDRNRADKETIKRAFLDNLFYLQGKFPVLASQQDYYLALAHTVRDRLVERWISTASAYTAAGSRTVAYLSAEFLFGPHLENNLINLNLHQTTREAMEELGLDFRDMLRQEEEPGLGNGGLGRLAACFLDSLATLEIPALGYGIRYEFGIFDQIIVDGWQVEKTDKWLHFGNPWEIPRPEWSVEVKLGGHCEHAIDERGRYQVRWIPGKTVKGVPYDTPILGYQNNTANTLRLWQAEAQESFDFASFNRGDYYGAVDQKVISENITKVLYPNDEQVQGKQLRLEQQFFFVSCALQDMFRILRVQRIPVSRFHEKFTIQLNDTHPAIAVAELMRLLLDEHGMEWDEAWLITQRTFAYTNHTLMPEALECWPLRMFQSVLPRHLELIFELNSHFLDQVRLRFWHEPERVARMSLIDERGERYVRMAHLACIASFSINGVARLHSELLKSDVLRDFYDMWPQKFNNKTNGVTPRRWLVLCNRRLTKLLRKSIGDRWITDMDELHRLEYLVDDPGFRDSWREIKRFNKHSFADYLRKGTGIAMDPESMFDVQVKRIHEYKRQHLNVLHIISLYCRLKSNPNADIAPRTFIFGGKAAPGYVLAKLIIKLINSVANVVNRDPATRNRLRVVFLPNFNVTNGQRLYPAAELSEQVSTAGKEASGTGNMKFCMNGAITIGTLDGANIEIRDQVGHENFFAFGLTVPEVAQLWREGYRPYEYYQRDPLLREVIDLIKDGFFSHGDRNLFRPLVDNLLNHDPYVALADFRAYVDCQADVAARYADQEQWTRMSILNVARSGMFSSDRTIREYSEKIWLTPPVKIRLLSSSDISDRYLQ